MWRVCLLCLLFVITHFLAETEAVDKPNIQTTTGFDVLTFEKLMTATSSELDGQKWDIAEVNLLCASNLPGAENLDIEKCLNTLDKWTARVYSETERHLYRFHKAPHQFNHSEAYFRILMLITVLEQDYGIHYNPMLISYPSAQSGKLITDYAKNSADIFIHGLLSKKHSGTCSSLPVLTVAVGRRLGYPLRLSYSTEHLFVRWESPGGKERFNIDSNGQGLICHKDEFYKSWPHPVSDADIKTSGYLRSLNPVEELAIFLRMRSLCLVEAGKLIEAQAVIARTRSLLPKSRLLASLLMAVLDKEMADRYDKKESFLEKEIIVKKRNLNAYEMTESVRENQILNQINRGMRGEYPTYGSSVPLPKPSNLYQPQPYQPDWRQPWQK